MSEEVIIYRYEYTEGGKVKVKPIPCRENAKCFKAIDSKVNLFELESTVLRTKLDKISVRGNIITMISKQKDIIGFIDKCYDTLQAKLGELARQEMCIEEMMKKLKGEMNGA